MSRFRSTSGGTGTLFKKPSRRLGITLAILIALVAVVISTIDSPFTNRVRAIVDDVTAPVQSVLMIPVDWAVGAYDWAADYISVHDENERLREENERLLEWRRVAERLDLRTQRLEALLNAVSPDLETLVSPRVLSASGGPYVRSVLINAGRVHGLEENLTATTGLEVIGRVVLVGSNSARVLLLTDLNSRVPVRLERSGENGIAIGQNRGQLRLDFLPLEPDVLVGDRVLTSGHGGIFPPDLPLGVVTAIEDDLILIEPLADLNSLDYIRILDYRPWAMEPNDTSANTQPEVTTDPEEGADGA